jgi:hypothetical protein
MIPAGTIGFTSFFIFILIFCVYMSFTDKSLYDPNLTKTTQGQASKIEFQGHTYVVWSVNLGGGIVHDPDCKCRKEEL